MFTFATCEVPRAIDFIKKMYPDKREQIPEIGTGGALWKFGPASVCRGACAREYVLEWLDDRRYKSPWIESFRERLESGAFDATEVDSEVQRLRAAINEMRQAVWDELVPINLVTEINKIAAEALSTTSEPTNKYFGAEWPKAKESEVK